MFFFFLSFFLGGGGTSSLPPPVIKLEPKAKIVVFAFGYFMSAELLFNSSHHDDHNRNRKSCPDLLQVQRTSGISHRYGIIDGYFNLILDDMDGLFF